MYTLAIAFYVWNSQIAVPQLDEPRRPHTVEGIRSWHHAGGLKSWPKDWPLEHKLDLNRDGQLELILAFGGYSRGMDLAVFTRTKSGWKLICDEVEGTPPLIDTLSTQNHGWHDFVTFQRSGRGGFITRVYTWRGSKYKHKYTNEIRYDDLYTGKDK